MHTYQRIEDLARRLAPPDGDLLRRAYRFARAAHGSQRRRHGTPYIEHPVAVAELAFERFGVADGEVLAAALLHDVLEDTEVTDLDGFPDRTVCLVRLLTDPELAPPAGARRLDRRSHLWADRDATVLKACDRLSNLADSLLQYDPAFCERYAWRTRRELLAPGLPLTTDPVARPLLDAAIRRCEERAAGGR
ncbi:MAG TPA: HD domain-containing protein [Candidatus Eisenbacteria bacterium]|nr:HD domain-containing protein [Candidatus Eisenbacteria bacterium]